MNAPAATGTLGMFVKYPEPGRAKTRLARSLANQEFPLEEAQRLAARLYAAFQQDLVDRMTSLPGQKVLCWTGDQPAASDWFNRLVGSAWQLWAQPDGDLGARLSAFFHEYAGGSAATSSADSGQPTVVIGSDSPTIPTAWIRRALGALDQHDVVIGPATDGGYYLLGLSRSIPEMFDGIDWSTGRVLRQTLDRVERLGLTVAALPPWYDVDDMQDLQLLTTHLRLQHRAGEGEWEPSPETQRILESEFASRGILDACVSEE